MNVSLSYSDNDAVMDASIAITFSGCGAQNYSVCAASTGMKHFWKTSADRIQYSTENLDRIDKDIDEDIKIGI